MSAFSCPTRYGNSARPKHYVHDKKQSHDRTSNEQHCVSIHRNLRQTLRLSSRLQNEADRHPSRGIPATSSIENAFNDLPGLDRGVTARCDDPRCTPVGAPTSLSCQIHAPRPTNHVLSSHDARTFPHPPDRYDGDLDTKPVGAECEA